jgi:hypothetical protein
MPLLIAVFEEKMPTQKDLTFFKNCHFYDELWPLAENVLLFRTEKTSASLCNEFNGRKKYKATVFEVSSPNWQSHNENPDFRLFIKNGIEHLGPLATGMDFC